MDTSVQRRGKFRRRGPTGCIHNKNEMEGCVVRSLVRNSRLLDENPI